MIFGYYDLNYQLSNNWAIISYFLHIWLRLFLIIANNISIIVVFLILKSINNYYIIYYQFAIYIS